MGLGDMLKLPDHVDQFIFKYRILQERAKEKTNVTIYWKFQRSLLELKARQDRGEKLVATVCLEPDNPYDPQARKVIVVSRSDPTYRGRKIGCLLKQDHIKWPCGNYDVQIVSHVDPRNDRLLGGILEKASS